MALFFQSFDDSIGRYDDGRTLFVFLSLARGSIFGWVPSSFVIHITLGRKKESGQIVLTLF